MFQKAEKLVLCETKMSVIQLQNNNKTTGKQKTSVKIGVF